MQIDGVTPGSVGIWGIVLLLVGTMVKAWPALRKLQGENDGALRNDLLERIVSLETQLAEREIRWERELREERARHEAEMRILRHRLNNETASLDALLLLLETAPERVSESITLIKEMRARREALVTQERTAFSAANIAAARGEKP